jgi:hypothetical protein
MQHVGEVLFLLAVVYVVQTFTAVQNSLPNRHAMEFLLFYCFDASLTQSLLEIGLVKKEIGLVCLTNHASFPLLQYRLKTQTLLYLSVSKQPFLWRGLEFCCKNFA